MDTWWFFPPRDKYDVFKGTKRHNLTVEDESLLFRLDNQPIVQPLRQCIRSNIAETLQFDRAFQELFEYVVQTGHCQRLSVLVDGKVSVITYV
jgi:hypothetical protein